jgi:hypothetical protein
MTFNYKWSIKEEGNYAIRKREAKGKEAGKEIEPKNRQTSDTHFFILGDKKDVDTMYNLYKINNILKTITYEYVYRGTDKKSTTKYLTKKDIEDVIKNIETYKGKTIKIETADSKVIQQKINKIRIASIKNIKENGLKNIDKTTKDTSEKKRRLINIDKSAKDISGKEYGLKNIDEILELLQVNIVKEKELKTEKKETGIRIKKLNKVIETIKNDLTEREVKAKAEKEKIELSVFCLLFGNKNKSNYGDFKEKEDCIKVFEWLYELAKADIQRQTRNKKQIRYNKKKKAESGKPKKET